MENQQQDKAKVYLIGGAFITLGILLLASLLNLVNSWSIYQLAIPILLIIAGISVALAKPKGSTNTIVGSGLIISGVVALLVRFNVLSGKTVNGVLGVLLIVIGFIVVIRLADKHAVKKTDV